MPRTDSVNRRVLAASSLNHEKVINTEGESLGHIEDVMLDLDSGKVAYAVLSFGGLLGMGEKLFAIPWSKLTLDAEKKAFYLHVDKDTLKGAPGFDKNHWPDVVDPLWNQSIHDYYQTLPYWAPVDSTEAIMQEEGMLEDDAAEESGIDGNVVRYNDRRSGPNERRRSPYETFR